MVLSIVDGIRQMRERSEAMDPYVVRVYEGPSLYPLDLHSRLNQWFFGAFRFSIHSTCTDLDLPMDIVRFELTD